MKINNVSTKLFIEFGKFFPYTSVDIIVRQDDSFILTKRAIEPFKGKWHLPGGVVYKNQRLEEAVKKVAKRELNLDVKVEKFVGTYQLIGPRHYVSQLFIATILKGKIMLDFQSTDFGFFKQPPKNTVAIHKKMIMDAKTFL